MQGLVPDAADVCVELPVPLDRVGAIVGRGGETLRILTERCGCRVRLNARDGGGPRLAFAGRVHAVATLEGPRANVLMGVAFALQTMGI